MKVAILFERSGVVRNAFRARGHVAISVDLESASDGEVANHRRCDVKEFWERESNFDLVIAHPPCTDLSVAGSQQFAKKRIDGRIEKAIELVYWCMELECDRIVIENPVSLISTLIRQPDQIIQPNQFGHPELKTTCLWLKNVPKLKPTKIVPGRRQVAWRMSPSEDRAFKRATTYSGIAEAFADQYGSLGPVQHNATFLALTQATGVRK